jgi:hypothetical protein
MMLIVGAKAPNYVSNRISNRKSVAWIVSAWRGG